jgi:hypothetical protein
VLPAGTSEERISELNRAVTTINRKAPAFLQGLIQFESRLVLKEDQARKSI